MRTITKAKEACKIAYESFERNRNIRGYEVTLPQPPPISSIANYGEKDESKRKFPYKELPENVTKEIATRELDRRKNGFWFFNGSDSNLNLEYITGHHYMMLQYFPIVREDGTTGNADFVDAQQDAYFVWECLENNPKSYGMLMFSGRRFFKTTFAVNIGYWRTTGGSNRNFGVQSKTYKDSKETVFRDKIVKAWRNMHPFWRPADTGNQNPTGSIEFTVPRKRSATKKVTQVLDSYILTYPNKDEAVDGTRNYTMYQDEIAKTEKDVDPRNRYYVARETCSMRDKVVGKLILTTTVDEMEKKSSQEVKKLWDESDWSDRSKETGRTISGLGRYFNPADRGFIVDQWGYSDEAAARKHHLAERKARSGSTLISYIRKYPLSEDEIFLSSTDASIVAVEKVEEQLSYNEKNNVSTVLYKLMWDEVDVSVKAIPVSFEKDDTGDTGGYFEFGELPEEEARNKYAWSGSLRVPIGRAIKLGVDPVDHKSVSYGDGSRVAMLGLKYKSHWTVRYVTRPDNPNDFYEDMIKCCVFCSAELNVENQKQGLINYFRERGYEKYLTHNPLEKNHLKRQATVGTPTTGTNQREQCMDKLVIHTWEQIGSQEGGYGVCPFEETLRNWLAFESNDWTKYDETVATMMAILAWETPKVPPRPSKKSLPRRKFRK